MGPRFTSPSHSKGTVCPPVFSILLMLKPAFLLLAFGFHGVASICFRNTTTTVRKEVIDRPEAIDEYHCKIICVEKPECLSFIYSESQCIFLGNQNHDGVCVKPYQEWIKKTNDADCPDTIEQPAIDAGYVPNPALKNAKKLRPQEVIFNDDRIVCPISAFMDAILPDNSHLLKFRGFGSILWDAKLGSWVLTIGILHYPSQNMTNTTSYIRAALCYEIDKPIQFADTTSCGGTLPKMPATALPNMILSEVQKYGETGFCINSKFQFIEDCITGSRSNGTLMYRTESTSLFSFFQSSYVICVDGNWVFTERFETHKIVQGICASAT